MAILTSTLSENLVKSYLDNGNGMRLFLEQVVQVETSLAAFSEAQLNTIKGALVNPSLGLNLDYAKAVVNLIDNFKNK